MVDVHCHILPGLDDGPEDMEDFASDGRIRHRRRNYARGSDAALEQSNTHSIICECENCGTSSRRGSENG